MRRRFLNKRYSPINTDDFLTIYALSDNLQVSLNNDLEYCIDGDGNWIFLSGNELTKSINAGQTISFKGDCKVTDTQGIGSFTITQPCNLQGNILSIVKSLNVNNFKKHYLFYRLFANTPIIDAYKLVIPFLNLTYGCYSNMFYNCTSLKTAPELPATTLESYCYYQMFYGCSSLTTAPELPATTLASYCYYNMFRGCTKLNYIKMLATNISASNCLNYWVYKVASSGTFVKHPDMNSLPTGSSGIPSGWTIVNDGEESGGGKIVNKVQIVEGGDDWDLMFDYPINSHLKVNFADGSVDLIKGKQQYSTGRPIFDKPTIVSIDPLEDDKYIYTW